MIPESLQPAHVVTPPLMQRFAIALLATLAAVVLRLALMPLFHHELPFVTLYGAVALSIWYGGWRPALASMVLGYAAVNRLVIETQPGAMLSLSTPAGVAGALVYAFTCLLLIGLGSGMRRARRESEAAALDARAQRTRLEEEIEQHRRTAAALQSREDELELITSQTPSLLTRSSRDLRYVFVNRATAAFIGRAPEDIIGRPIADVVGADGLRAVQPHITRVLAGETVEFDTRVVLPGFPDRIVHATYIPDRDANGAVVGWFSSGSDITERRRADARMEERERLFRTLVNASSQMVWHYRPGAGTFERMDEGTAAWWRAFTGQSAEELIGAGGMGWLGAVHPEDRESAGRNWRAIVEGGDVGTAEFRVRRNDGAWRWLAIRGVPTRDEADRIVEVAGTVVDITEKKEAKAASEAARQQLQVVTDSMSAPVVLCTKDLRYAWVNRSYGEWIGRPTEEIMGQPIADILGIEAFTQILPYFREVLAGRRVQYETEVPFRRIGRRWVSAIYTPTRDAADEVDGWVAVVIDTTEHKRMEAQLKEADRRKDEFLATLAHELRNPLAPVRNAVQILRLEGPEHPDLVWARDVIDRQTQQMARLIDDLLDVSRITHGSLELRRERVDLARVLQSAVETSRPLLDGAGHELTVDLPAEAVHLDGDITRLAQVFSNLLNNAAKYSPRGSRIGITAERQGDDVVVFVRDNGVGIPAEMLPVVFEMFAQVDRSLERTRGGLGIGLTLAKRLVELHDGTVEARSDGVGRGSEFVVRLPIPVASAGLEAAPGTGPSPSAPPLAPARVRVLVADDNPDSATSLGMMLSILGYETRTANDGLEATRIAGTFQPDVALLDIGMPGMNGYDVARTLRAQPWADGLVLVAVTGWGQAEDRRRTLEAGFDHHLVKPVDPTGLAELLATAVSRLSAKHG